MEIRMAQTSEEMAAVFGLRFEVFVDEQKVPREIELDEEDTHALHFLALDGDTAIGCARLLFEDGKGHIGRLAVKKAYRSQGVGSAICRFIMEACRERGCTHFWLNAQLRAVGFYESLGFRPQGETFWEAGIEHIQMVCDSLPVVIAP